MRRVRPLVFSLTLAAAVPLGLFAVVTGERAAFAQTKPDVTMRVDSNVVGVGDDIHVSMQASTEEGNVTDAQLVVPRGFSQRGSSSGPSTSINIINGRMLQRRGLNASWTLRADKTGSYDIGPASISVDGKRFSTSKLHVSVVPAGQAPRRPQDPFASPFGNPFAFDPFKGLFQLGDQPGQAEVTTDPKLGLDQTRGAVVFLHATIDKTQAVVGEQVTLSIYLYQDLSERDPDSADVHEATTNDFLKRPLFEDDANNRPLGNGMVAGRPWAVKLVRKVALFPLKTGDLEIGPMSLSLIRVRGDAHRESETLRVQVSEPPVAGRPPGYTIGDVGNFQMSADVTPHDVERDGAIGVTVDLSGTGNLPSSLVPPVRAGIEWLAPEVHEKMGATRSDRFGGKRTFEFVVRMHKEGDVDLGTLSLPYFNPDTRTYGMAQAALGIVHVKPGAAPVAADTALEPLQGLPPPRATRSPAAAGETHLTDRLPFWLGLGGTPLVYFVLSAAMSTVQSIRKRRAEEQASPETELKERILVADRACKNGDAKAGYAAIIRALESATIAKVGVNVRDATASEIARRLEEQGVEGTIAARFETLLKTCEAARFSPDALPGAELAREWQEAKEAIGALRRHV